AEGARFLLAEDVDDERIGGGTALGGVDGADRERFEGEPAEPVDGLGGEGDEPARAQERRRLGEGAGALRGDQGACHPVEIARPGAAGRSTMHPNSRGKHISESATAIPPSLQSWALRTSKARTRARTAPCTAFSAARSSGGGRPAVRPCTAFRYSVPPRCPPFGPQSAPRSAM